MNRVQLTELLDTRDAADAPPPDGASYRISNALLRFQEPGASPPREVRVQTRWLTEHSIAVLLGRFIHPGSATQTALTTKFGAWITVNGRIDRCQYLTDGVHEAIIVFDEPIPFTDLCQSGEPTVVIIADENDAVRRITARCFDLAGAVVHEAADAEELQRACAATRPTAILVEPELPGAPISETITALRGDGFTGRLVAFADATISDASTFTQLGFDEFLAKPISPEDASQFVESLDEEPIVSVLHGDAGYRDLIDSYVREFGPQLMLLQGAVGNGDFSTIQRLARSMKINSESYGFSELHATLQALEAAAELEDTEAVRRQILDLARLSRRVRGPSS